MNFNDLTIRIHRIPDEFPEHEGAFLVRRNRFGVTWWEVLVWDGRHWVTSMKDDPDSMIEAWVDLEEPDKAVNEFKLLVSWEDALKAFQDDYETAVKDFEFWSEYFGQWMDDVQREDVNESKFKQYSWRRRKA